MIKTIFMDLDDTILDFHKAEAIAVAKAFRSVGVEPTEALITRYSQVNKLHWEMLERGELTREQVLVDRFAYLYRELGLNADARATMEAYEDFLCIGHYFLPGAQEALDYLSAKYTLYLASNGTAKVQDSRLASAKIGHYFKDLFISQRMGAEKPTKRFFDLAAARIKGYRPEGAIIIGDSLTSDIRGGLNAEIHTCWFNPKHLPPRPGIEPEFEIHSWEEIQNIL